jgi:hypothetical protein
LYDPWVNSFVVSPEIFPPAADSARESNSSPQLWREMPCAAERIYQFFIERDGPEMLPEAIRVVDLRWHQRFFWTQVKAAST